MTADYILFRDNRRTPWQLERVELSQDMSVRFVVSGDGRTATLTGESPEDYPEGTMESGGGGGVFNVNLSGDELVADKTFQEISDAFDAGAIIPCYTGTLGGGSRRLYGFISDIKNMILGPQLVLTPLGGGNTILSLSVSSPNSYPQFSDGSIS